MAYARSRKTTRSRRGSARPSRRSYGTRSRRPAARRSTRRSSGSSRTIRLVVETQPASTVAADQLPIGQKVVTPRKRQF